jgi:hypothetical protein
MEFYLKPDVPQKIHVRGKSVPTLDNAKVIWTWRNRKENIIMWILEIESETWLLSLMNFDDHEDGELIQLKDVEQGRKAIRNFKKMLKESATRS